ncbi:MULTISPECIES: DUF3949 domain-containing protein [unclassified Bacillus (in: firmicutes)]|uniref:DUF3949 domain-containing protein n=1 Tax=unclassified Bacillus (in: firmicutes) TaxID=185979 RepID=UPI0008ED669A|nr:MULTISPECIES: DUF3949 domain-containing protein [unclassified Bacillus (in: firmicutes)]SFA86066.1 Protein of unknown function [Bacillus sp. UNCCL13]SFQ83575.1 Protein of unknown function [Bacillus sp. cl95]
MLTYVFLGIFVFYVLLSLFMLPFSYRHLVALKEMEAKNKLKGKTQGEMYDRMNAGELMLHENAQGNPIFLLTNILASIMYRVKHPKN